MKVLVLLVLTVFTIAKSPPTFNYSYSVPFTETVIRNKQQYQIAGQEYYDPSKNR